ncbi:hypothetical protein K435DRAFT_838219 [Dendrothele bispora CBS 962.96]|uniref:DUF6534 domain-containing protein n=1 Tax=Dendrothele bispora (strain CBS 962.96) TaxID=1314807 RepID=A0A4S8M885_DENBC|nr:hypothetical protein K435DRAFT_838219 [Dendrothele bispora CBS 962.96]
MMPSEVNLPEFTVDPFFYGIIITSVLFGITILQVWIYINTNRDKWPLRCLVALLFCLDLANTCLTAQILHYYFVSNFGNIVIATTITNVIIIECLITLIITLAVELFFASRVWLTGMVHWIVPILIAMTALGGTVAGIVGITDLFQDHSLASLTEHKPKLEVGCNASLSAVSDMITTIALLWGFSTHKIGIKQTDTLLEKLCRYIVTRGLFVTMDQTVFAITFLIKPEKLWWTPFHFSLSKVYVITMVAMLNARGDLRKRAYDDNIYLSDIDFGAGGDTSISVRQAVTTNPRVSSNQNGTEREEALSITKLVIKET